MTGSPRPSRSPATTPPSNTHSRTARAVTTRSRAPRAVSRSGWQDDRMTRASYRIGGRQLVATPVVDTYWRFAAARQAIYEARLAGAPAPWSDDPVLQAFRFTNVYRAADRVSQFLISEVIY